MNEDEQIIPIRETTGRTYVFPVDLMPDAAGGWQARIPLLPGCVAWGHTEAHALEALTHTARGYVKAIADQRVTIPIEIDAVDTPVIAVTV